MGFPRYLALTAAAVFLAAAVWIVAAYPPVAPVQFPEGRSTTSAVLKLNGTAAYRAGIEFDQVFLYLYPLQLIAWTAWIAFGKGERERSAMAAAAGAALMVLAAAWWDARENVLMLDLLNTFDGGRMSGADLIPLRTAATRKWGYLGMALLLAGIANGFGMWTRRIAGFGARRIRTWVCIAGGLAGIAGGSALLPGSSATSRWMLFQSAGFGLAAAAAAVVVEAWPGRAGNR